ncbi:unnamed protein product [Owenia fusiformis]|uniref:Wnt inhibitory factor 1 n=1 Tax=Owenia fusiformis TaxID=6347 RepID=A0A8J1UMP2_OWEFU|nr:unnamed protein product [Owenia fusiformis]
MIKNVNNVIRVTFKLFLMVLPIIGKNTLSYKELALWIDRVQVKAFIGSAMQIDLIRDGAVVPYLENPKFQLYLPPIPSHVHMVNLTWAAGKEKYVYHFEKITSLDRGLLFDPILNIPDKGAIPSLPKVFHLSIPCTGRARGTGFLRILLRIVDDKKRHIKGSPVDLKLRKVCSKYGDTKQITRKPPQNPPKTSRCLRKCLNGGVCNKKGKCQCAKGFRGKMCQKPLCRKSCGPYGECVGTNKCRCRDGWVGRYCRKRSKRHGRSSNKNKGRKRKKKKCKANEETTDGIINSNMNSTTVKNSKDCTVQKSKKRHKQKTVV